MINKFRNNKSGLEVEAIRFNGNSNKGEIEKFIGRQLKAELESDSAYIVGKGKPLFSLRIQTNQGEYKILTGDWIIKQFDGIKENILICKNNIFLNKYKEK